MPAERNFGKVRLLPAKCAMETSMAAAPLMTRDRRWLSYMPWALPWKTESLFTRRSGSLSVPRKRRNGPTWIVIRSTILCPTTGLHLTVISPLETWRRGAWMSPCDFLSLWWMKRLRRLSGLRPVRHLISCRTAAAHCFQMAG